MGITIESLNQGTVCIAQIPNRKLSSYSVNAKTAEKEGYYILERVKLILNGYIKITGIADEIRVENGQAIIKMNLPQFKQNTNSIELVKIGAM